MVSMSFTIGGFQSTPLREGRPPHPCLTQHGSPRFNPRPCARGDSIEYCYLQGVSGFNPRPCARGD